MKIPPLVSLLILLQLHWNMESCRTHAAIGYSSVICQKSADVSVNIPYPLGLVTARTFKKLVSDYVRCFLFL